MTASAPGPADAAQLAALAAAIPDLVRRLGGSVPAGSWDYDANRLRIQHRPGAGISAMYRMPAGTGFNELGATTEKITIPGVAATSVGTGTGEPGTTVSGWIHPRDPLLPDLALAADRAYVQETWGEGERLTALKTIAYRPLRRAVLRATFTTRGPLQLQRTIFLKVGRPDAIAGLRLRHRLLDGTRIPVPATLAPRSDGILALEAGRGESLGAALRPHAGADLDPKDFIALLDALPPGVMQLDARRAWSDSIQRYLQAATLALPRRAEELAALVQRITAHLSASDRGEQVPAHGDFYDANILLSSGKISALLDLDSLGPGYRVDDLACLLGHLAILPSLGEKNQGAGAALERFARVFERTVDPRALWARSAAVALTLIAGSRGLGNDTWEQVAEARLLAVRDLVRRADAFA
ncbi:phosphotransferase [Paeniglutamicibacter sp. MACA_103]|uniref:phosphotransferase n=1 Tax=Paeniglutamicibacter sp. MACA_103 TaxID=3377337 RepID=UPI003893FB79